MIAIQAAGFGHGFGHGGADMIRGSFSTSPHLPSTEHVMPLGYNETRNIVFHKHRRPGGYCLHERNN
jgi:hypothetical protein